MNILKWFADAGYATLNIMDRVGTLIVVLQNECLLLYNTKFKFM